MPTNEEFRVITTEGGADFEKALNEAGAQGWTPVNFHIHGLNFTAILKRLK